MRVELIPLWALHTFVAVVEKKTRHTLSLVFNYFKFKVSHLIVMRY